jgi:hypothetical protein
MRRMFCAGFVALIIAGGAVAAPASAAKLESFAGTGTGYALRVTLDLRNLVSAVPALAPVVNQLWGTLNLGSTPGLLDQTFIKTSSDATGSSHKATSVLAEGLIDLDSLEATKIGDSLSKVVQTLQIPSANMPIIDGGIGTLKAAIPSANGVNGSGVLESVKVGLPLDQLTAVDGLTAKLTETVAGLTDQLGDVLSTEALDGLTGGLTDQIVDLADTTAGTGGLLGGIAGGLNLPVADLDDPEAVTTALDGLLDPTALLDQITGLLNTSLLEGALADLTGLINITKSGRTGDGLAIADSTATLKELNVLGGLVDVSLFNLKSHSEAAGVAGSAKNSSSCSLGDVKIGGGALALGFDGKTIYLNGEPVPVVGDLVGTVKGLVDQVLAVAGIEVGLCENSQNDAEADGSAAANRVSALRVKVAPLDLFSLVIDPTVETQAAAQVQAAPVVDEVDPPLPRTGPAALATVLSGIGLAGVALFARKRFFAR